MSIKLKDISLFEGIDENYTKMVIDNSRREEYNFGDFILRQGATSNGSAYIIQKGLVRVEMDDNEIAKLGEGDLFGEIALITDEPRVASVIAESEVVVLRIDRELLHTIIKEFKNGKEIQDTFLKRILENIKK